MIEMRPFFTIPKPKQSSSNLQNCKIHTLDWDQYYTPDDVAVKCLRVIKDLGLPITEMFETSAGMGAFIRASASVFAGVPVEAVDIEPKADGIKKADFLNVYMSYKKGRMFLGNPPFGSRMSLATKFFKKCVTFGDYVAWILPISQLNNSRSLYEFDLVVSLDLGEVLFSEQKPVRCCFNVYKRPDSGNLNPPPTDDCKSVKFMRSDNPHYAAFDYDIRLCTWGGSSGKILEDGDDDYTGTYKLKVVPEYLERVLEILRGTDWEQERPSVSCKIIPKGNIVAVLKRNGIP
ncbi:MAG: hypothetical protein IKT27_05600 [Clostridia bacterium]|nr:hypothetical protein [Clostridia bacterium]